MSGADDLWRHRDFLKLWAAQAVSSLGARITREGLPFAAVMSLGATPAQVGILAALSRGPGIVIGLAGGGFVDRGRRRPIMIGADVGRALALATIPLAAWTRALSLDQIYGVAALVGALSVLFDIADHAYLPTLIAPAQLVDGNARLATTDAVAEIGGPALYGVLFQFLTAPVAIAVNAGSYLFSAAALATIRAPEPTPAPHGPGGADRAAAIARDFRTGLGAALGDPAVRALLAITTASSLFGAFFSALYIVFALRTLHLTAGMLGATVAVGGVAALAGATLAGRLIRRFGLGWVYAGTGIAGAAGALFIPLAGGSAWTGMAMLMVAQLIGDSLGTVAEIAGRTLRQSLVPPGLMGRVGGVFAVAQGAMGVAGAVAGGWLGQSLGVRQTLLLACAGIVVAAAGALTPPLTRIRTAAAADAA